MTEQEFVDLVIEECHYYNVKCSLTKAKQCNFGKGRCSGYFDHSIPELRVAMLNDMWLQILVHEYCHLRQWIEKDPIWMKCQEEQSYEEWEKMSRGLEIDVEHHISNIRDLELANEKRSVALIKKLKLPIDVGEYIKKANSYIMFYNYMKISKRWCVIPPYKNERIMAEMPTKFSLNYSKLSKRLETIFREEGY
jgi:hypothetical protein